MGTVTGPLLAATRVTVCDPGVGNIRSVVRSIEAAAARAASHGRPTTVRVTRDAAAVRDAEHLVVPGQGAFGTFVRALGPGLHDALRAHLDAGRPYLGICLGMQLLFESSEEAPGGERGLGYFAGDVRRLTPGVDPVTTRPFAVPHVGWNSVDPVDDAAATGPYFYFLHSFAAAPADASIIAGTTTYGAQRFASMVARGPVLGVQFHPEKSQREGLALLERFLEVA
ncbi:MAG: Imidazole glycerol phosphate synthase amidotransferase subunit [Labilithrix sp.]|nr:Imidazole glycerol phosphate synthase amidotransferase subunit [Labilithrix sp.]